MHFSCGKTAETGQELEVTTRHPEQALKDTLLAAATPMMDGLNHQELATPTEDPKEAKTDCHITNEGVVMAQKDSNKASPLVSTSTQRALVDSLSTGCYDEGELDYDELMEGDRVPFSAQTAGHENTNSEEVEEGEVTSDEEGEIKDDDGDDSAAITKKGGSSKARQLPSLEGDHDGSKSRKWGTEEGRSVEDLSSKAETTHTAVCRHFIQGKCSWGQGCRFLHHDPAEKLHGRRDFPFNHGHFGSHFGADAATVLPLGGGHPHKAFPLPIEMDSMCPPFLPIPEPLPPSLYRDPNMLYHGSAPRTKWGTFQEGGKLKTSDVEEESEGWHRLRTVTRRRDIDDDSTHVDLNDRAKDKKVQKASDSGDSSPEHGKNPTPSSNSEVWTDPWARQGPPPEKKQKRHDVTNPGSHHGDAPLELVPKKNRDLEGAGPPVLRQRVGTDEVKRLSGEEGVERGEEKACGKETKVAKKLPSPGEEEEGGGAKKRGLSASPPGASDDASDAEGRKAPKKKGRKEGRASNRDSSVKKSVGDSPKGGGEGVPNTWEGDGSKKGRGKHHRSVSPHSRARHHLPPRGDSHLPRGRGRPPPPHCGDSRSAGTGNKHPTGGRRGHAQAGSGAWRTEVPAATQRGSSGDEGRSPTPAPSDSISSESDSAPEGRVGGAVQSLKQLEGLHHAKKVCDWEERPAGFKPKSDEDGVSKSRQAKLKEELEAINREIERKKRTQAARV